MSKEALIEVILADGQAKLDQLEQEIQHQMATIESEARAAAAAAHQEARQNEMGSLQPERSRRLHETRLQSLRNVEAARRDAVNSLSLVIEKHLDRLRDRPDYPLRLRKLVFEAVQLLIGQESISSDSGPGEQLLLEVDARDEQHLHSIVSDLGIPVAVQPVLDVWGGAIACSSDGCIRVDNTLEKRLMRLDEQLYSFVEELVESE